MSKLRSNVTITWKQCSSYNEAKDFTGGIYLHERDGEPFYWGIAHTSSFGTRYNSGYKHWVEASLENGDLFIGQLDAEAFESINKVEKYLVSVYPSVMNVRGVGKPYEDLKIKHKGEVPYFLSN